MISIRCIPFTHEDADRPYIIGEWVHKKSGSYWEGKIVGFYSTTQTHEGYCVQLLGMENGPVQIYPRSALVLGRSPGPKLATSYPLGSTESDSPKDSGSES